ncbi:rhomboid family intramembrane serine protease [Flavobacterium sp. F372]|uniref:Rhomboid family intramembrane serine protease n=1 Tax=Flavobacterium bernardetii TaxID=2813823 RepID=A0ABR7IY23_9FLAO|nr:rhomboid family intramembrane serine protease [Flavobacterium bernardetii]MBC5834623.1 rhomboid family intramembrane serine protease [Flavobacterium bernardetii]NHF70271.1 rhomboid family intramembrane serine protease [Flavobacterium bernardetii]
MNIINEIRQQYKLGDVPQKLIFINILVFLLSIVFFFKFRFGIFDYPTWLALSSDYKEAIWFPWTLLTYSFLHSSPFHLLFNLIFLYFISSLFYTYFNTRQFLTVYFFGSVFAGFVYLLYGYLFNHVSLIVGASGSVMAIFIAVAAYAPNMTIKLPFIGFVKIWHIAVFYIFVDLLYLLSDNTGGHVAHLSGSLVGFAFAMLMKRGIDISAIFIFKKKKNTTFKKVYKNKPEKKYQSVRVADVNFTQRQIDEILEKISKSGYDSLTKEEKEFLFKENK